MATPAKILVVDADPAIGNLIQSFLSHKYQIEAAVDGKTALAMLEQFNPDLVIMDNAIGYNLCQQMKSRTGVLVIVLTSQADQADKIRGFEDGADDYLTKPFGLVELGFRVAALLKRSQPITPAQSQRLVFNHLAIDPVRREVTLNDQPIVLTALEFDLLHFLARHPGKVWRRRDLIQKVWDYEGDWRVVDVHIGQIRKKIEIDPTQPRFIHTTCGVGYKFELPTTRY